jgi:hypothetical protein
MVTGTPRNFKITNGMIKINKGEIKEISGQDKLYNPRQCKKALELFNLCKNLRPMY